MSIHLKQINNFNVNVIKTPDTNHLVKGYDLVRELYANIFLCANKKSGKTNVLFNILRQCIGKKTKKVYIFCNTIYKDANYKEILKWLNNN